MSSSQRVGVFFACDTGSGAYAELRAGLGKLTTNLGLQLVVFDQEARSDDAVLEKVERLISQSLCLVADVGADPSRPINPNVMLEIGFARGMARPIMLIVHDIQALPSNLKGRDVVKFPECLRIGSAECERAISFLRNLGRGLLGGREMQMFSSRSPQYLEILKKINELPGQEWYVGPELRAFFRPLITEARWLLEVRQTPGFHIDREKDLRADRRQVFETNLQTHGCTDVYPLEAIKMNSWRGMPLTQSDKIGFLTEVIRILEAYPLYHLVFLKETEDRQKYWIKDSEIGKFIVFEGWGYVDVREDKRTGGLIMTDPTIVQSFIEETKRKTGRTVLSRDESLDLIRQELRTAKDLGRL